MINAFVLSIKGRIEDFVEGEKVEIRKAEGSNLGSLTGFQPQRFDRLCVRKIHCVLICGLSHELPTYGEIMREMK